MIFLIVLSIVILLLYVIKIGIYNKNWARLPETEAAETNHTAAISVVIAFRNEEENLPSLLHSLKNQQYPVGLWEVILVDDHSFDGSALLVKEFSGTNPFFRYLECEPGETGKKAALIKGVREASHNLIVTTDADCTMGELWISVICNLFNRMDPALVIGLVDMSGERGFFNRFQEIEFLSLIAAGTASAAGGRPIYCNAANMAFKKEFLLANPDPMKGAIPSGDDTMFMHRVKRDPKNRIMVLKSPQGVVKTRGVPGWKDYLNQRIRWASKSRYYTDADIIYAAGLVLAMALLTVISLVFMIAGSCIWLFPVLLGGKFLPDYVFLNGFLRFLGKRISVVPFIVFELIYPFYIIASVTGAALNWYSWKGRNYIPLHKRH